MAVELTNPWELHRQLQADQPPLVLDVRMEEQFTAGHIPGALHIPFDELIWRLEEVPNDRPVITYCNMMDPGHSESEWAAQLLIENGYRAQALFDGFGAWEEAEFPVERWRKAVLPHMAMR